MTRDLQTGEIARATQVTPRTVAKWIDSGLLKGYKIPGPGGHRRVPRVELLAFLRQHNLPLEMMPPDPSDLSDPADQSDL